MKKKFLATAAMIVTCSQLSGCMGQMATSQMVTKLNLDTVDNRYGRAGLFALLSPVYGLAATADLFVFNSIEFWTGTNPLTDKEAVVDLPTDAIFKMNKHVSDDFKTAPVKLSSAQISQQDERTLVMTLAYEDGSKQELIGSKGEEHIDFYLDDMLVAQVSLAELAQYQQAA
ncbi:MULTISPECIES: DUF3332 domain-containing protein [unclassified Shewanella]|uniref:DUF3332 domain-containing protein n=1 Tax=unclassified Shewanella TaxID=196818 RepID=UPI000C839313|nr:MULTISPECIES: DUF3332 domain-containing protein [unclassified Shewanella]MDO6620306.1 DUF3332 domain-containing protein [Shewanella sp. 6_MG-2023]MDO6638593.1 DUF3332 domain-containing protein [Shewanella sp. 5_MG-2023]MDO6679500.1 DUF3332 domain-containing protein [Shewanella sp. 4_MG-2023]MDO6774587.1 DUF3332 domain-containing protein [Shewanella sp. 3_MG-2023]PMG32247.1 hypothetical protein BCU94_00545 [Shewanella sp. 10N.286.52.C2]